MSSTQARGEGRLAAADSSPRTGIGVALFALGLVGCATAAPATDGMGRHSTGLARAPGPPLERDAALALLDHARTAWEKGDHSHRMASQLEAGGRAMRAHGATVRSFAAVAHDSPRATGGRVLVSVADQDGKNFELASFELEDAAEARAAHRAPRLFPRKIMFRSPSRTKITPAADGTFILSAKGGTWLFPSVDRPPLAYRGDVSAWLDGRGTALVLETVDGPTRPATAHVIDMVKGVERFSRAGISRYGAHLDRGGRWFDACPHQGQEPALVVDAKTGRDLFASTGDVRSCAIDETAARIAIVYDQPGGKRVEVWSLAPPAKLGQAVVPGDDFDSPTVRFDARDDAVELVAAPSGGSVAARGRWRAATMRPLPPPAKAPRAHPKPQPPTPQEIRRGVAQLPVAAPSTETDLYALASLASPGSALLPSFYSPQGGWCENGVRSPGGATFALLEDSTPEPGQPALLVYEAATLTREHRLALEPRSHQISTVFYIDDATVAAFLEGNYSVYDVATGELLVRIDGADDDGGPHDRLRLLAPDLLSAGPLLFDLSRDAPEGTRGGREVDAPFVPPEYLRDDRAGVTVDSHGVSVAFQAGVAPLASMSPPWLLCEIDDAYYPSPACR